MKDFPSLTKTSYHTVVFACAMISPLTRSWPLRHNESLCRMLESDHEQLSSERARAISSRIPVPHLIEHRLN